MKRKTLFLTIPFIISLFIIFQNIKLYVVLSCLYIFSGIVLIKLKKMQGKQFFITVLSCLLAFSLFSGYNLSKNELISRYTTGIHTFSGKITNIKEYAQDKTSYTLKGKFENGKLPACQCFYRRHRSRWHKGNYCCVLRRCRRNISAILHDEKD